MQRRMDGTVGTGTGAARGDARSQASSLLALGLEPCSPLRRLCGGCGRVTLQACGALVLHKHTHDARTHAHHSCPHTRLSQRGASFGRPTLREEGSAGRPVGRVSVWRSVGPVVLAGCCLDAISRCSAWRVPSIGTPVSQSASYSAPSVCLALSAAASDRDRARAGGAAAGRQAGRQIRGGGTGEKTQVCGRRQSERRWRGGGDGGG
ncbi:hypothetical protein DFH27DRAFT_285526 [Peziza echinospora]|nr:hypothetical protein DFH27DRAFT_285526 [Peziza echinospora]